MKAQKRTVYQNISDHSPGYWVVLAVAAGLTVLGFAAAYYMEHHGHYVTGMNNQVVWGLPHVFAIFLIVAASGALNAASVGSVFGKHAYKPLGRLSGLLAITLLLGGLGVLVLDLGRPDRLITAMTYYNFKSIFAWNIILYTGFIGLVALYLMTMFINSWQKFSKFGGTAAFVWRFILTTGTGSIFGFLVAREAFDAAILAPLFIVASLSFGTAIYLLVLIWIYHASGRPLGDAILTRLKRLNAVLAIATLFLVAVYHVSNLYATEHHGVEHFVLASGSSYTYIFWFGQILLGTLVPVALFLLPKFTARWSIVAGALMIILGGFCMVYVLVIGGQAYPMDLITGMQVSSGFGDGDIAQYTPRLPELLLGLGGVAFALFATLFLVKVLPFVPQSLADSASEPAA